jgi:CheY-like chemotaxis protein
MSGDAFPIMNLPILVVEDNPCDRELTVMALEKCGVRAPVDTAIDAHEAQQYLLREGRWATRPPVNPLVVLLDMRLPVSDGLDVVRCIRRSPSTRYDPVVALTASDRPADIERAYEQGVNAYLVKAFDIQEYVASMCVLLSAWSRNRTPHY